MTVAKARGRRGGTVPVNRGRAVPSTKDFVRSVRCGCCGLPMVYGAEIHYDNQPGCKPEGWKPPVKNVSEFLARITGDDLV